MSVGAAAAAITAVVALLVAIITCRQWITDRSRLRHELFDRRYEMYEQIASFVAEILQLGKTSGEPDDFLRRTKKAYFVFGCDENIKNLVADIYDKSVTLHALDAARPTLATDELQENIKSQRIVKEWFQDTLASMEGRFEKYLKLRH